MTDLNKLLCLAGLMLQPLSLVSCAPTTGTGVDREEQQVEPSSVSPADSDDEDDDDDEDKKKEESPARIYYVTCDKPSLQHS